MSILEILLAIGTVIALFSTSMKKYALRGIIITLFLFLVLHFLIEGMRWQMIPIYIALIFSILKTQITTRWLKYSILGITVLLLLLGTTFSALLPRVKFPKTTGTYTIGTQMLYLTDTDRPEDITPAEDDFRELSVQIWYPSTQPVKSPMTYMDGYADAFAQSKGLPGFLFNHFGLTKNQVEENLPIATSERFPIVILSHGYLWNAQMYMSLVEEIVSQGYLVFGINHTYECPVAIFPDGKKYPIQAYFDQSNENMDYQVYFDLENQFRNTEDATEKRALIKAMMDLLPYNESIERWSKDISFVIDEISQQNATPDNFLYQKLDTSKIGLLGHSFGGGAVGQACFEDSRVKAGINLDGAQWGSLIDTTLRVPFLAMFADRDYEQFVTPNFTIYRSVAVNDYYEAIIKNSGHANFGDLSYWFGLPLAITETGSIDARRMTTITNKIILTFFAKYIRQEPINILEAVNNEQFPEVNIQQKK